MKEVLITLEYLRKKSLQVKKTVKEHISVLSKNVKLKVVFNSSKRIQNAFRVKDILPK